MDITSLLTSVVTGAIGGNAAGAAMKDKSLGTVGNTVAGAIGGGVLTQVLPLLTGGNVDISSLIANAVGNAIIGQVGTSGIGGAVAMAAVAMIKQYMNKSGATPAAPTV
ncbi:MAG: hypothetical protein RI911_535 [Candidatus Parcubacteria bacterium]|jgi:hypothetical protein